jgi:hypothetical protein
MARAATPFLAQGENRMPSKSERAEKDQRDWPLGYLILWILVVVLLIVNLLTLRQLVMVRRVARQAASDAAGMAADLQTMQFTYTVLIDQDVPIYTEAPLSETVTVPITTTLPVDVIVTVPVDAGLLGSFDLDIPINTTVPIDLEVDVPIDQTFTIQTDIPLYLEVPVAIDVAETPLHDSLGEVQSALSQIADELGKPLVPLPFGGDGG